jgi:hypothetical protein
MPIDTLNRFGIAVDQHHSLFLMLPPQCPGLTPDEALNLAAWLVVLAEPNASHTFVELLEAIANT